MKSIRKYKRNVKEFLEGDKKEDKILDNTNKNCIKILIN